jgi:hypothetical protein
VETRTLGTHDEAEANMQPNYPDATQPNGGVNPSLRQVRKDSEKRVPDLFSNENLKANVQHENTLAGPGNSRAETRLDIKNTEGDATNKTP